MKKLKCAVIQMASGTDKKENLKVAEGLTRRAIDKGAKLVALPEVFNFRGDERRISESAEPIPGPSLAPFIKVARQKKVHILIGSIAEKVKGRKKAYNSSILINSKGRVSAIYRKMHLFDVSVDGKDTSESKKCLRGRKLVMTKIHGIPTGLSICYDLRFPEMYREYSKRGAQILCVPSNFTQKTGKAHWETLLRARAIENLSYVLAPNQCGVGAKGLMSHGHSLIIDPWGKILARASGHREEILHATLDFAHLQKLRRRFPALTHRTLQWSRHRGHAI